MLHTILISIDFFTMISLIALVLLQRGKGAEAGAGFGAGASGTVFGARGAGTALSRATAILAAIFMITSLALTYVGAHTVAPATSVLDRMSQQSKPANPVPTSPAPATSAPASPVPASPAPASPAR